MRCILTLIFLIFSTTACQPQSKAGEATTVLESDREGRKFITELSEMIQRSDRIVVTEHSFEYDLYDSDSGKSLIPNEIVYGTRQLNKQQHELFLSTIKNLDPKTQDSFSPCIFEGHHTVKFYSTDELLSTMNICFHCGQVEWDATSTTPPWALYSGLENFIIGIGFQPERDWSALAKEHQK